MWPMRRKKYNFTSNSISCPKCNEDSYFEWKCENHHKNKTLLRCNICKFQYAICMTCLEEFETKLHKLINKSQKINIGMLIGYLRSYTTVILLLLLLLLLTIFFNSINASENAKATLENENLKVINKLRKLYPSQKNETWYHFMSVLEKETPTVKSIMFLHGEDKRTSECLLNELVSLYTKNKSLKNEEITFSTLEHEVRDYGIVLEHYRQIVKKFRVFITDLSKVKGSIARIFHSLCDEVSSDIKPSLFIFTLMYNKRTETLKPMERATTILKEAWEDLPKNELFPLFSRIIKNVVDIIPEKKNGL